MDAAAALAAAARDEFGRLDVVVNNLGGTYPRPFLETSTDFLTEAFRFNVATAHALTRAAAPVMLDGGGGAVVNISSIMGRVSGRGFLAYGTAKAALAHLTELTAYDLAPRIRVNAIAVGSVATSALDIVLTNDELRTRMEQATPLRRIGDGRGGRGYRRCSWPRRPAATSRARCSRSTAACRHRTSTWACRIHDASGGAVEHRERGPARDRRDRRAARPRAGRGVGVHPGQGRPGRG